MTPDEIIQVIADEMEIPSEKISLETTLEELEIDSLRAMILLHDFEDRYDIDFPTEAIADLHTIGDIITRVEQVIADEAQNN